jgi:hypothetical protein
MSCGCANPEEEEEEEEEEVELYLRAHLVLVDVRTRALCCPSEWNPRRVFEMQLTCQCKSP